MEDRGSRFWNVFWVVAPLIAGAAIGFVLAGQFPASTATCPGVGQAPSTTANLLLAIVLVALLIGRAVSRSAIGPVAARGFTLAAFGLIVVACGSFFVNARNEPCPPTGLASGHEAMVRIPPSQLHVS